MNKLITSRVAVGTVAEGPRREEVAARSDGGHHRKLGLFLIRNRRTPQGRRLAAYVLPVLAAASVLLGACAGGSNSRGTHIAGTKLSSAITLVRTSQKLISSESMAISTDGSAWTTDTSANQIVGVDSQGHVDTVMVSAIGQQPRSITRGADGNLYFTVARGSQHVGVAFIDPSASHIEPHLLATIAGGPGIIASGPSGDLWMAAVGREFSGEDHTCWQGRQFSP